MSKVFVSFIVVFVAASGVVEGQAPQRPSRPYRGLFGGTRTPDPTRNRHELTLTASIQGGYDDIVAPEGSFVPTQPSNDLESGYTGTGDLGLRYWYGREARSISADLRGFTNAYTAIDVDPTVGGSMYVQAASDFARRHRIDFTQSVAYEPSLVLGAFAPLEPAVDPSLLPDSGRIGGLTENRSWSTDTRVSIERRFTTRQTTTVGYGYSQRHYLGDVGFNGRTHVAYAQHHWAFSRRAGMELSYNYSDTLTGDTPALTLPVVDQTIEAGATYTRRLSPTRQLHLAAGGGTVYVETQAAIEPEPVEYWAPSGYGTVRLDIGRTWSVSGDYRRAITVLQGVSLSSFATDAASVRADGALGSRLQTAISAALSRGVVGDAEDSGRFETYSLSAQARYAVARWCALSLNYDYYYYDLHQIANLPGGLPQRYDRNALRLGITFWLPLYGTYSGRPVQGQTRGGQ